MTAAERLESSRGRAARSGPLSWLWRTAMNALTLIVLGLLASIAMELAGMALLWPDQGAGHSRRMLATELGYLDRDFRQTVISSHPAAVAQAGADLLYRYTGLQWLERWLQAPPLPHAYILRLLEGTPLENFAETLQAGLDHTEHSLWVGLNGTREYVAATGNTVQVYGLRLAVCVLSLPASVLFAAVGLVDGLVQRDLRKFGAGHESGFMYHQWKKSLKPVAWLAPVIYLACPVSVHPNWVFLPAAGLQGFLIGRLAANFKKFL